MVSKLKGIVILLCIGTLNLVRDVLYAHCFESIDLQPTNPLHLGVIYSATRPQYQTAYIHSGDARNVAKMAMELLYVFLSHLNIHPLLLLYLPVHYRSSRERAPR